VARSSSQRWIEHALDGCRHRREQRGRERQPSIVSFGQVAIEPHPRSGRAYEHSFLNLTLTAAQTTGLGFSTSGPGFPLTLAQGRALR